MFDAGAIIAKLQLQKEQWDASIKSVQNDLKGLGDNTEKTGRSIAASVKNFVTNPWVLATVAITGALTALVKKTAEYGDELWKTSQKTGIAVETLSGLKLAAEKSDLSLGGLAMGMSRLSRLVVEANQGGKEQAAVLERIGITATDATGKMKPMDTLMGEVADKFKVMPDGVEKSAMAMDIFGKSGMEMVVFLNLGSEGLKRAREESDRFGTTISGPTAKAGEDFNDTLTDLKAALLGVTLTIGKELLPVFTKIVEGVVGIVAGFNRWLNQNPEIIQAIKNIIESIKWLANAVKDVVEWIPKMANKFSGMAELRAELTRKAMALEAQFEKEQKEGHERWLARHNAMVAKKKEQTAMATTAAAHVIAEEKKVTADLGDQAAQRERIIEKQYDKFVKEANDAFKKMAKYSDKFVRDVVIDEKALVVNAAEMSNKMTAFFVQGMNKIGIKAKEITGKVKKSFQDIATAVGQYVQIMQQGFSQFFSSLNQLSNARYQRELQHLESEYQKRKEQIASSLLSEQEKNVALSALDEEYATNRRALENKQAKATKESDIAQAYMNMFAAIVASWKLGWPLGAIAAAIAAAACMVQIKAIKAQPLPGMARGGLLTEPTPVIAGEAGPEAFVPLPDLKEMLGIDRKTRGQRQIVNNFNIRTWDGKDTSRVFHEKLIPLMNRAMRREALTVPALAVR